MRITTRGHMALRASLALARLSQGKDMVTINTISEEEKISPVFLEQIFYNLKNAGLVKSLTEWRKHQVWRRNKTTTRRVKA